jgi:phage-related protein
MKNWSVHTLNAAVDKELEQLPVDMLARFTRVSELIEKFGPQQVGMPHVRSLRDKLWEIRASGRDGIARGIYIAIKDRRIIVLRVFIKKTEKTPGKEIDIAKQRAREAGLL